MRNSVVTGVLAAASLALVMLACEMAPPEDYRVIRLAEIDLETSDGVETGNRVTVGGGKNQNGGQNQGSKPYVDEGKVQEEVEDALEDAKRQVDDGEDEVTKNITVDGADYTITLRKDPDDADVYDVAISGLDLTNENAVKGFIRGIQAKLGENATYLDLSACNGAYLQPILGNPPVDKSQFVSITLPGTVKELVAFEYGWGDTLEAFDGFDYLKTINAPGLTKIEDNAFSEMDSLVKVSFPVVESIGDSAFQGCTNLETAEFSPLKVTEIGAYAFDGCKSLLAVDFQAISEIPYYAFQDCENLVSASFNPLIRSIDVDAFKNCKSLTEVNFPNLEVINNGVFEGCKDLQTAGLGFDREKIREIGVSAFAGCKSLTTIDFPNLREIDDHAFEDCIDLTTVTAPRLEIIGEKAFANCDSLNAVNFSNVRSIDEGSFFGCTALTSINLPEVVSIGAKAFEGCEQLVTLRAPKATHIGDARYEHQRGGTFSGCKQLETLVLTSLGEFKRETFMDTGDKELTIYLGPEPPLVENDNFKDVTANKTVNIKVPNADTYENKEYTPNPENYWESGEIPWVEAFQGRGLNFADDYVDNYTNITVTIAAGTP